jgi:hypothetical protein
MASALAKKQKEEERLRLKEQGFQMGNLNIVKLKEYNSLYDSNMRHFFENRNVQRHLYSTGQIDRHGRVIDLEKNKAKINILEREFSRAELIEERRQQDELEMRYRVQRKRFNELERVRKEEILLKLKHDRALSKEIINTMKSSTSGTVSMPPSRASMSRMLNPSLGGSVDYGNDAFFITNEGSITNA